MKSSSGDGASSSVSGRMGVVRIRVGLIVVALSCLLILYITPFPFPFPFQFLPTSFGYNNTIKPSLNSTNTTILEKSIVLDELEKVLHNASMKDKTVIITTLNEAWAEPNSILDLFMESFRGGEGTEKLLKHLVIVCLDEKAYVRCLDLHPHCYFLDTTGTNFSGHEAYFMTPDYLDMMWRRIQFLITVLEKGYNFVFTDADIMWLRDPFPRFYQDAEFQIASDTFFGDPSDTNNLPNGGFNYVKSSNRTIMFYKFWYSMRKTYPGSHDQDVFNRIKNHPYITNIKLQIKFFDTLYFGGFCEPSKDFNVVCTMHANCCMGLANKVKDLNLVLQNWRNYTLQPRQMSWSVPKYC